MRFVGRGHPAIRATHAKTLEFAPGPELTERGTCIVAVEADPQPAQPMAGPVRIRITAGGRTATVRATANSSWDPSGPIVVRRSPQRLPGTFATDADTAASGLPRELITALQDPDTLVTVDVVAAPTESPTVVLFAADASRPDDPRLRAELEAADVIEAQDAGARGLVAATPGAGAPVGGAPVGGAPVGGAPPAGAPPAGIERGGMRRLVVATSDLPRLPGEHPEPMVEVVGLPTQLAVVAAAGPGAFTVVPAADVRRMLRRAGAGTRVATRATPNDLPDLLAFAHGARGGSKCVVAQPFGPILRADAEHPPTLFGRDPVYVCFDAPRAADADALDPAVHAAMTVLLADGVPTRTAAAALARLTGQPKRTAYAAVLALAEHHPSA